MKLNNQTLVISGPILWPLVERKHNISLKGRLVLYLARPSPLSLDSLNALMKALMSRPSLSILCAFVRPFVSVPDPRQHFAPAPLSSMRKVANRLKPKAT